MRSFKVPFDMNEEEKIVGGHLTIKPTGYLLLFGVLILITILAPIGGSLKDVLAGQKLLAHDILAA